ncbi:membrane progestin receptor gamma isoform X3 [Halichoerus grypus]
MGTSCVYPLASSCAHTFSSMSKNARHICYFLDYGAVNLFSLGSAIAYSAYSIPDVMVCTTFHDYYVPLAVLNTVVSTGLSCYSRFLEIQKPGLCKMLRVLAFAYPYTWDSLPIFYRMITVRMGILLTQSLSSFPSHRPEELFLLPGESVQNEAVLNHQKHMAMTLLASFFYSAHLPERLAPGRFDYIGHSHQLFHVCVILATHMQMEAILLDKTLRKEWLLAHSRPLSFPQITGAILLCLIFSLSNIIYFSAALYRIPEPELHKKET